jgi:hypothetical protein
MRRDSCEDHPPELNNGHESVERAASQCDQLKELGDYNFDSSSTHTIFNSFVFEKDL